MRRSVSANQQTNLNHPFIPVVCLLFVYRSSVQCFDLVYTGLLVAVCRCESYNNRVNGTTMLPCDKIPLPTYQASS